LTYSPNQGVQTQLRLAREISQLDFNDFVSATVFEDDDIALGNPNLQPETTWVAELSHERRFGELGVIKLTAFHHWISNVLDLLPITSMFEAPGNIGDGRRWGAELGSTIPLEKVGLSGARLDVSARWQDSSVVDPVTGEDRVLSGGKGFSGFSRTSNNAFHDDNEFALIFDFRQDFEQARVAWGWIIRARSERTLFNVNELDVYDEGFESDAFIETTRWLGMKIRIIGENLTNADQLRNRTVFLGERDLSLIDFRELEKDRDGIRVILQMSGSF
jgi:outer membrane receptor protein involved in Fe transport